jgi:hypothetical protein
MVDRGQALTLEAVSGGILLLLAIGFALQMTAVTPLSASTSSQHLENQLESSGEGVLASTAESGALKTAVLNWDNSSAEFNDSSGVGYYRGEPPDNAFGDALDRAFGDRNIAYNVIVHHQLADGSRFTQRMIYQGQPSDHAVSASRTVALADADNLTAGGGPALEDATTFYAEDAAPGDSLYNLVRVEVIAWRI